MTSKNTLAAAMLLAALPAALLGFFLVSSFLTGLTELSKSTMLLALYAVTLLCCAGVVFLPVAVLIFGPKSAVAPRTGEGSQDADEAAKEKGSEADEPFEDAEAEDGEALAKGTSTGDLDVFEAEPASSGDVDAVVAKPTSTGDLEIVEGELTSSELGTIEVPDSDHELAVTQSEVPGFSDEDFAFDDEVEEEKPPKKKKGK